MVRSSAVVAALVVVFSIVSTTFAQTKAPIKPADKTAPKTGAAGSTDEPKFTTMIDKVSYGIGLEIGSYNRNYLQQTVGPVFKDLNMKALIWGVNDGLTEESASRVGDAELKVAQEEFAKKVEIAMKALMEKNTKAAQAFLATNKSKQGVKTTKSGLQYLVMKSGNGAKPKPTDHIRVRYKGTRTDGSIFEATDPKAEPTVLDMQLLIPGWKEALAMMKCGDKWTLYVPPELAYAEGGNIGIEPNSLLIYELELVSILSPDELAAPAEGDATADLDAPAKPAAKAASTAPGAGSGRKPAAPK